MGTEQRHESGPAASFRRGFAQAAAWWRDSLGEQLLSVLFPPRCVGCRDFETYLCDSCRDDLTAPGLDACPRCGAPGPLSLVHGRCAHCMASSFSHSGVRSAYLHRGVAQALVAEFKFGGQAVLGRLMSDLARNAFRDYLSSIGPCERVLVTWVPVHGAAKRERGYNQSELLARGLATGPPDWRVAGLTKKTVATKHQKELGRAARQSNLRGAFALRSPEAAEIAACFDFLVLVDDVYTTGATAQEVSSVLVEGTQLPVHVFTFSRAVGAVLEGHD